MSTNIFKKAIDRSFRALGYEVRKTKKKRSYKREAFTEKDIATIEFVMPYTMTSYERVYSVIEATKYIEEKNLPGSIVECGVWRGGSSMAIARTLKECGNTRRDLYLYDTYEGMPEPTEHDVSIGGSDAAKRFEETKTTEDRSSWCEASLEDVQQNMKLVGYNEEKIHYVQGKVEETIPETCPEHIALLRLDTDWYESTKHELAHLYPRLVQGGVLIIDDYGHWEGARKAVDEYFAQNNITMLLNRIDYTGRVGVKS